MYCGQESPSPSRPDSASGRGHPCKVTFMLQICSCHAPVSGPSVASCSFRPKTNVLAHLQGRGAWSQPISAALPHTFVLRTLAASQVLAHCCRVMVTVFSARKVLFQLTSWSQQQLILWISTQCLFFREFILESLVQVILMCNKFLMAPCTHLP